MTLSHRTGIDKQDLRHMESAELSRLGVRLVNPADLILECNACKERWSPQLDSSGKLPFDYWICPAQCNSGAPRTRGAGG